MRNHLILYCSDGENRCSEVSLWKLAWLRFCILLMLFTSEVVTLTLHLAPSDFELRRTFLSCRVSEHKDTFGDSNEFQFCAVLHLIWHLMCHKMLICAEQKFLIWYRCYFTITSSTWIEEIYSLPCHFIIISLSLIELVIARKQRNK